MADNFPLTPGVGRSVATDQVTYSGDTADVQLFRPVSITGAEGSKTVVDMPVGPGGEPRSISHRDLQRIAVGVTDVTTATTNYTAGDQVGSLVTFANASRSSGGSGMIVGVVLIDQSDVVGSCDVVFFDSSVTLAADNTAFSISDTDSLKIVGIAPLIGAYDTGANRICQAFNIAIPYVCSGGASLYAAVITRADNVFFTSGQLPQLNIYVERN